jgi:integrase
MPRGKGIYKRGNVYWICYNGLDGRVIRESSRSRRYDEAELLLDKRRKEVREGNEPEIIKIPNYFFKDLAEEYIQWSERQRSFVRKAYVINQLVREFGNYRLRQFSTKQVELFQTQKIRDNKKPATINRYLATIKHMFTKAVDWNMAEEGVLKRIRKVKLLEENNRRLRYLPKEECQQLIKFCNPHLKPIVVTALNTGMRKSEILSLKWDNVDLRHGFILLDVTKNGERREVPINKTLRETLETLRRGTKEQPPRLDIPWVFYDAKTGNRFTDLRKAFRLGCKKSGINDFRFHDLRHTFASHLVMAGVDLTTVKELLGHKTLTMTLRYAHLAPSHKISAVNILDEALTERSTSQLLHSPGLNG